MVLWRHTYYGVMETMERNKAITQVVLTTEALKRAGVEEEALKFMRENPNSFIADGDTDYDVDGSTPESTIISRLLSKDIQERGLIGSTDISYTIRSCEKTYAVGYYLTSNCQVESYAHSPVDFVKREFMLTAEHLWIQYSPDDNAFVLRGSGNALHDRENKVWHPFEKKRVSFYRIAELIDFHFDAGWRLSKEKRTEAATSAAFSSFCSRNMQGENFEAVIAQEGFIEVKIHELFHSEWGEYGYPTQIVSMFPGTDYERDLVMHSVLRHCARVSQCTTGGILRSAGDEFLACAEGAALASGGIKLVGEATLNLLAEFSDVNMCEDMLTGTEDLENILIQCAILDFFCAIIEKHKDDDLEAKIAYLHAMTEMEHGQRPKFEHLCKAWQSNAIPWDINGSLGAELIRGFE